MAGERISPRKTLHGTFSAKHSGLCTTDIGLPYTRHHRDSRYGRGRNHPLLPLPAPIGTCWCPILEGLGHCRQRHDIRAHSSLVGNSDLGNGFRALRGIHPSGHGFYHSSMNYTTWATVMWSCRHRGNFSGPWKRQRECVFGVSTAMIFAVIQALIRLNFLMLGLDRQGAYLVIGAPRGSNYDLLACEPHSAHRGYRYDPADEWRIGGLLADLRTAVPHMRYMREPKPIETG